MIENALDASAVLAFLFGETGADKVEFLFANSTISRINVTEVLTKLVQDGLTVDEAKETFDKIHLEVAEFDENQSLKVAELRPLTKHLGLSLGDRCCLALAITENLTAVTADKTWAAVNVCKIEVIR